MTITDPTCMSSLAELFDSYRQNSNRDALGEVFDRTAKRLLRVALRRGYGRNEAEDLLQQTFLTAMERRARYDVERPLFLWLIGILNHEMHRFCDQRRRRPDPERMVFTAMPSPFAELQSAELGDEIHVALAGLPERYRSVLRLRLEYDLAPQEIADRLNTLPSTVRVRLHRGLALLRSALPTGLASAVAISFSAEQATAAELASLKSRVLPDPSLASGMGIKATVLLALMLTVVVSTAYLAVTRVQADFLPVPVASVASSSPGDPSPAHTQGFLGVESAQDMMPAVAGSLVDVRLARRSLEVSPEPQFPLPRRVSTASFGTDVLTASPAMSWIENSSKGPVGRYQTATVYDTIRRCTMLFGGHNKGGLLDDTWLFDGAVWRLSESKLSPSGRAFHAMAFDAVRGHAVMFGGHHGRERLNDTWEFDGREWRQRMPSQSPPARVSHGMVYDDARGVTIMFGGFQSYRGLFRDTWQWDGEAWLQIVTASAPPGRDGLRLVFDSDRELVILFGGWDPNTNRLLNDTWEFDGVDWRQVDTAVSPDSRHWHAMTYDRIRKRTVLYGGLGNRVELADTWEFDGEAWTQVEVDADAEPRAGHAMSFDSDRGVSVVHGGVSKSSYRVSTFEYPRTCSSGFELFGSGCGHDLPPRLRLDSDAGPTGGQAFTLQIRGIPEDTVQVRMLVTIGSPDLRQRLDLGELGLHHCVLHTPGGEMMSVERSGDRAVWTHVIPDRVELRGLSLTTQAFMLSPSAANSMGLVLSNAGHGSIEPPAENR